MTEQPRIRPAHAGDVEHLAVLAARTFRDAFARDNAPGDMNAYILEAFSADRVRSELASADNLFLLAFLGEADPPVGYAKVRTGTTDASVKGPDPLELERLYVDQSAIGSGIGAALMQASLDVARRGGRRTLWLGVWEHNARAIAFYRRWGFEAVGDHVFRLGSDDQTDLIMERAVDLPPIPDDLRTDRLYLRSWQRADAGLLLPVLEANVDHLGGWIPAHVAAPASLDEIELRLASFAEDFQARRSWRYAIFPADQSELFGEVSLFPRSSEGRVEFASADRLEIGYWLRRDATGNGYATEVARAMLKLAEALPDMKRVEIHCDPRNAPSAAVPRRLGFRVLSSPPEGALVSPQEPPGMVWIYDTRLHPG